MTFTKSDLVTIGIGLAAAVALALGEALVTFEASTLEDPAVWGRDLLAGVVTALGRYITTRLPEWVARRGG